MKFPKPLLALLATLVVLPSSLCAQDRVLISEIMADNKNTLAAEDGKFYDWVELYNADDHAVNLQGWVLGASGTRWQFPATNLNANAYLVVFASGLNRSIPGRPLHTSFQLKKGGEHLFLLRPDGSSASDYPTYPQQVSDISYGYPVISTNLSLVSAGAAGRLLVPASAQGFDTWMRPELDDSTWAAVTNGIGFEAEAATAIPTMVIGDSVADFRNTQGSNSWFYGYWDKKADADGIYDPVNDFVAFPRGTGTALNATNYWSGSKWDWPAPNNPPWTELSNTGGRPSGDNGDPLLAVHWAIRRYVSETNGPLRITGTLAHGGTNGTCGDGVIGRIFVDGVEVFARAVYGQSHGYSLVVNANLGSRIDFALDPGSANNDQCDVAAFTAVIRSAGNAAVVADTLNDWSETGAQGQNNWSYGYCVKTNSTMTYTSSRFAPFPSGTGPHSSANFWDGTQWRWFEGDPPFDTVGRDSVTPSIYPGSSTNVLEHWVIRRWVSEISGAIAVDWHLGKQTLSGGGVTARIYQNGTQRDVATLGGTDFVGVSRSATPFNVQVGDLIDFSVEPGADVIGDQCFFTATILGTSTLSNLFRTDVGARMSNINATALLRLPFTITNALDFTRLTLRLKYEDGFIAYLNGSPVASRNAPGVPQWNSAATAPRVDAAAAQWEEFDLTKSVQDLLRAGPNVLAIQGLNRAAADRDFLLLAELSAGRVTVDTGRRNYFLLSTPGSANGSGTATLGPLIDQVQHTPLEPAVQQNLVVTARLLPTMNPVKSVRVYYRVMFGSESNVVMLDDGLHGDGAASDGLYGAVITNRVATAGQMIRYYLVAQDTATNLMRDPPYPDLFSSQYYGAVLANPALTNPLPVLHLFITDANMNGANGNSDARYFCSVSFLGEFYDNIGINLHGQSSSGFPKKSYDLDFNKDHHFRWNPNEPRVTDINLLGTYADKAHMRNILAHETYRDAGSPYHFTTSVRVQTNGGFFGDWFVMENGGSGFLKRLGRDPNGALYKMYNSFASLGDTTIGINGAFAEKKTRKDEGNADLVALFNGVTRTGTNQAAYVYDNLNVSESVNMIATRIVTGDVDCCHKNYYFYRDSDGTGEWEAFPWDVDLSFGRNWSSSQTYWDDAVYAQNGLWIGNNNSYFNALFNNTQIHQMYLRRVRTLMDELQQTNGTPAGKLYYENRIDELAALIEPDAALDLAKWGTWGGGSTGVATNSAYWRTMPQSVDEFKTNYLVRRRQFVFDQKMGSGEFPAVQPTNVVIKIGNIDFNPLSGNQAEEYIQLLNTNKIAVDISGWTLSGAVQHTFQGGVVMPTNSQLFVVPDKKAFRQRTRNPRGGMGLYLEGPYQGQLSARGETIILSDKTGRVVQTNTYPGAPTAAQRFLRITEIMYHPPQPPPGSLNTEEDFEYLELKNIGTAPLDLTGVGFTAGVEFSFTGSAVTNLLPGQRVLVVRNLAAFTSRYSGGFNIAGQYIGALANSGDTLRLVDRVGEKVLEFRYENSWYPITDGPGASLVIVNENAAWDTWGLKSSWRPSALDGGSPGAPDPAPNQIAPVLVNEVLSNEDPPALDAIELYNPGPQTVDVSGWFISDDTVSPKKFTIPAGTRLAPGGYQVFTEHDFNPIPGVPPSFAFSSYGDQAFLFSGDSTNITGYMHGFQFGAAARGVAFGRYTDSLGREQFVAQSTNSLGAANAYPLVGPVVISEIMYHPLDLGVGDNSQDEYIELHNITTQPVPLFDPLFPTNTWRLRTAVDFDFPTNRTLSAGGYLLVVSFDPANPALLAQFRDRYSLADTVPVLGPCQGNLNNAGDNLELYAPDTPGIQGVPYVLVEQIQYSNLTPWPEAADGVGPSLQRLHDAQFGNDPTNWTAALSPGVGYGGTPPVLARQPSDQTVVAKRTASFSISVSGTAPLVYQWRLNGANLPGANGPSLIINNVQPKQAGIYSVLVYNPAGYVQSSNATLTVLLPPSIITQPLSQTRRAGTNLTLSVVASSTTSSIRYQWQFNGVAIPGATASSFTIPSVHLEDSGDYRVVVTDDIASEVSDIAHVNVVVDPTVVRQPQSKIVAVGQSFDLSVEVTNIATLPVDFLLKKNNGARVMELLLSQRVLTNIFTNAALTQAASYFYALTNPARTTALLSSTAYVAVVLPPTNLTVDPGADASFTVVVGVPGTPSRPAPLLCQWQFNGQPLTGVPITLSTALISSVIHATNTLKLTAVQAAQAGTYGVLVSLVTNVPVPPALFTATLTLTGGLSDRDGDGMPDAWELAHGLNPDDPSDALTDADGDGMSNLAEYLAGTDPQDAHSYLKVELEWTTGAINAIVKFGAVSNKTYSVLYQNLLNPTQVWGRLTNVPATPTNRTVRVLDSSPGAPARFYRLVTPQRP